MMRFFGNGFGQGMMGYRGYGYNMMSNGGGLIMMFIILALIIFAVVFFTRHSNHAVHTANCCGTNTASENVALKILNERYARGEVTEEEYNKTKSQIK